MKKYVLLFMALACLLSLAGCSCEHEWLHAIGGHGEVCNKCGQTQGADEPCSWVEATCDTPKKCVICGKTEGKALGHSWNDATCDAPKTCARCGETEGEALGHTWTDATCTVPKTCAHCGKTEGKALGHSWNDATGASRKCTICGEAFTDPRFSADACRDLFGHWEGEYLMTGEMMGDATIPDMPVILAITFRDDGTFAESVRTKDKEGYNQLLKDYYIQALYAEFELNGLTKEQADQAMIQAYGMDVEGYAAVLAVSIDWDALLSAASREGVYYVADGQLYSGDNWDMLVSEALRLENNTLILSVADIGNIALTKVS